MNTSCSLRVCTINDNRIKCLIGVYILHHNVPCMNLHWKIKEKIKYKKYLPQFYSPHKLKKKQKKKIGIKTPGQYLNIPNLEEKT